VTLVIVDEAAQVADDGLFVSLMPMLAVSAGTFVCASTPFGRRGWFWERWEGGDPDWERYRSPAVDCPRISPEFLAEQRRVLGPRWFDQEYNANFVEAEGQVFSTEAINAAFDSDLPAVPGW
jgi:hypothetical protein